MDIIIGDRQSGRTTELIRRCAKIPGSVIVCPTRQMANYVWGNAKEMGYDIPPPTCPSQLLRGYHREYTCYLFDEVELILSEWLSEKKPIVAVTIEEKESTKITKLKRFVPRDGLLEKLDHIARKTVNLWREEWKR